MRKKFALIVHVLITVTAAAATHVGYCPKPLNIVFMMDASDKIDKTGFEQQKTFVKNIISYNHPNLTKIAIITFHDTANLALDFTYARERSILNNIKNLRHRGGAGDVCAALNIAGNSTFQWGIRYSTRIVVVMTSGLSLTPEEGRRCSQSLKKSLATLFVVGVGKNRSAASLYAIASSYFTLYYGEMFLSSTMAKWIEIMTWQMCDSPGPLQLHDKSGNLSQAGTLQLFYRETWTEVCPENMTPKFDMMTCRNLGFQSYLTDLPPRAQISVVPTLSLVTRSACNGSQQTLAECADIREIDNSTCISKRRGALVCKIPARVTESILSYAGRVEVQILKTWGTVCSDGWDLAAAHVLCRSLNYTKKPLSSTEAPLNGSTALRVMWIRSISCKGNETSLEFCQITYCGLDGCDYCRLRPAAVVCDPGDGRAEVILEHATPGNKYSIPCSSPSGIYWPEATWEFANGTRCCNDTRAYTKYNQNSLGFWRVHVDDGGVYLCRLFNRVRIYVLNINGEVDVALEHQYFHLGGIANVSCNLKGFPALKYSWLRDGKYLCDRQGVCNTNLTINKKEQRIYRKYSMTAAGSLLIASFSEADEGSYKCKAQAYREFPDRNTRVSKYEHPAIIGLTQNKTLHPRDTLHLVCDATGAPPVNISWLLNGLAILHEPTQYRGKQATSKVIRDKDKYEHIQGVYTCIVFNEVGNASRATWVVIEEQEPENLKWLLYLLIPATLLCALLGCCCCHRKRRKRQRAKQDSAMSLDTTQSKWNSTNDVCHLPKGSIRMQKLVGVGAFGEVWKAVVCETTNELQKDDMVAVKKSKDSASDLQSASLKQEIEVNKSLEGKRHPHIVNFLGCVNTPESTLMLMEYVPYGDLLGYLRESRGLKDSFYVCCEEIKEKREITPYELFSFAKQIASGMCFLASNKIIHRDLAARNILVGENLVCKITDFGLAKVMHNEYGYMGTRKGRVPIKWTAPEVLFGNSTTAITSKSDVWSYGITLYEIFTLGGDPYPGWGEWEIVYKLKTEKYVMEKPEHVSDNIYDIMLSCWQEDPGMRPPFHALQNRFSDLVESEYYLDLDMMKYQGNLYMNIDDMDNTGEN